MSIDAEQLHITSPCPITLDHSEVSARDRQMFCAHCAKDVHLLSQMREPEVRALMRREAGKDICVSYSRQGDGSIRFRRDPNVVPASALRRAPPRPCAPSRRMGLGMALGASLLLAACTPHESPGEHVAGGIEAPAEIGDGDQAEPDEAVPCDTDGAALEVPVAGGLISPHLELEEEPIPTDPIPTPQPLAGGLRAEPIPEAEPFIPEAEPEPTPEPGLTARPDNLNMRGGMRAHPVEDKKDPTPLL